MHLVDMSSCAVLLGVTTLECATGVNIIEDNLLSLCHVDQCVAHTSWSVRRSAPRRFDNSNCWPTTGAEVPLRSTTCGAWSLCRNSVSLLLRSYYFRRCANTDVTMLDYGMLSLIDRMEM